MKEKVLFISNNIYLDSSKAEGGVRVCTKDYIRLLEVNYEVILFPVETKKSLLFRFKSKLGLASYDAFDCDKYLKALTTIINRDGIKLVFLNMSNLLKFSAIIKQVSFGNAKVVLCSHGNESGDYLHEVVRFTKTLSLYKKLFSSYSLGQMLKIESFYRLHFIDMVLTVSEVEEQIENWLGAKNVFMVPRTITENFLELRPVGNRFGFVGDLSHYPNYFGIKAVCDQLQKLNHSANVRIVGGPKHIGETLKEKYDFVTYRGYLDNEELKQEASTWRYFLNPVFYFSRGVSTKLAMPLSWGLPLLTTTAGIRGYNWLSGKVTITETVDDMANSIATNNSNYNLEHNNAKNIAENFPTYSNIMQQLLPKLNNL